MRARALAPVVVAAAFAAAWSASPALGATAASLGLAPSAETNLVSTNTCITATARDAGSAPAADVSVVFTFSSTPNITQTTGATGETEYCYTGPATPMVDNIIAFADNNGSGTWDPGEPLASASRTWAPPGPALISVTPNPTSPTVGNQQCLAIHVAGFVGQPIANAPLLVLGNGIAVSVNDIPDSTVTTDDNGNAQFCYTGTKPGSDNIQFVSDQNGNGHYDSGEVYAFANLTWIAPDQIDVSPNPQTLTVDHQACVTAHASYSNAPVPQMQLLVLGNGIGLSVNDVPDSTVTTDDNGDAQLCYTGTKPGSDNVQFVSDLNGNGLYDSGEVYAFANVTWIAENTAPVLTVPGPITAEATGPTGAVVTFSVSASDAEDSPPPTPTCDKASGDVFPLGTTTVACTVTDSGKLSDYESFHVTVVDTTPPTISGTPADISVAATSAAGAVVTYTSPTASDLVDGSVPVDCAPASGSTFPLGTTTVTCTATDAHSNTAQTSFHVVVGFTVIGFLRPVDNSSTGVVNVARAGSTVSLKFRVEDGAGGYVNDLSIVASFTAGLVRCDSTDISENVITSTGGTSLRYDSSANQFIQNWKTPTTTGECYRAVVLFVDGQKIAADFRLK